MCPNLPDVNGVDGKIQHGSKSQDTRAAGDDEIPFDELFGSTNIVVNRIEFFAVDVPGPHVGDVHIADQFVERQAEIIAEQDQPLEVGVGLSGITYLKILVSFNQFCR